MQIRDRRLETDRAVQTDPMLDRPSTPLFVPSKTGADVATQIYEGDVSTDSRPSVPRASRHPPAGADDAPWDGRGRGAALSLRAAHVGSDWLLAQTSWTARVPVAPAAVTSPGHKHSRGWRRAGLPVPPSDPRAVCADDSSDMAGAWRGWHVAGAAGNHLRRERDGKSR